MEMRVSRLYGRAGASIFPLPFIIPPSVGPSVRDN